MRNRNGFTLVELLAVITILGFLAGIAAVAYTTIMGTSKNRVFETYEKTMEDETMNLLISHVELAPKNNETKKYMLSELKIDKFINPIDKDDVCENSYVIVKRNDTSHGVNAYEYTACLICQSYVTDKSECKSS